MKGLAAEGGGWRDYYIWLQSHASAATNPHAGAKGASLWSPLRLGPCYNQLPVGVDVDRAMQLLRSCWARSRFARYKGNDPIFCLACKVRDVFVCLLTGSGSCCVTACCPQLYRDVPGSYEKPFIVVVVSPFAALIKDQVTVSQRIVGAT